MKKMYYLKKIASMHAHEINKSSWERDAAWRWSIFFIAITYSEGKQGHRANV
jgi:hypothetical protein